MKPPADPEVNKLLIDAHGKMIEELKKKIQELETDLANLKQNLNLN